jgi:hypothetical protein
MFDPEASIDLDALRARLRANRNESNSCQRGIIFGTTGRPAQSSPVSVWIL